MSDKKELTSQEIIKLIREKKSDFWDEKRKTMSLDLFYKASENVPAYKNFLKKNKVDPKKIKTWEDFQKVPVTDKNNYLRAYPLKMLCWNGTLEKKSIVFASTSGSTGEPFYFPREKDLDWQYSFIIESFIKNNKPKGPTLVIVAFGLGVWIGGIITYKAFEIASQRNNNVSILTTGINKGEIFNALEKLAPNFSQTILVGYPPFVKDIVDEASDLGINIKKLNLRFVFAAEPFNEEFRKYLAKKAGIKNYFLDTMNIYGTADIGAMAFETPLSILIRNIAVNKKKLFGEFFSETNKIPTLAQFNPLFINFEAPDGNILLNGDNTVPLIRYSIGDRGGVFNLDTGIKNLQKHNINLGQQLQETNVPKESISNLPFVYVYERHDMSTKLYGAIIHSEHIREALLSNFLSSHITGKFTVITKTDKKHNQYLEINCELKKGEKPSTKLKEKIKNCVIKELLKKNTEYKNNHQSMAKKVEPLIVLWQNEDPTYFKSGVKQKWVKKLA